MVIILKSIIFIILLNYFANSTIIFDMFSGNSLSLLHVAFAILFSIFLSIKYDILKIIFNNNSSISKKIKLSIIVTILFLGCMIFVYDFLPSHITIDDWFFYEMEKELEECLNFIYIPMYFTTININLIVTIDLIYTSILLVCIYIIPNMNNSSNAYAIERFVKSNFRCITNLNFIFFIIILTISNRYTFIEILKYVEIAIISIYLIVFVMITYLSLKACKDKNNRKLHKENLIVVLTLNNMEFGLYDDFLNPLHKFRKYDSKNIAKSLIVDGEDYTFINYDAVRYDLIDITKFNKIAYLIVCKENWHKLNVIISNNKTAVELKMDEIENLAKKKAYVGKGNNFVILYSKLYNRCFNNPVYDRFKNKYPYRFKSKIDLKNIIYLSDISEEDDVLKLKCSELLKYIEKKEKGKAEAEDKNIYIKYALNSLIDSFNHIEYFYFLLKVSEYITHYMGLKSTIKYPEKMESKEVRQGFLSSWRNCIDNANEFKMTYRKDNHYLEIITEEELINSINEIIKFLNYNVKPKTEVDLLKDICLSVSKIRNNLIAHGSLTYEVAKKMTPHLFNIACTLVQEFENIDVTIYEDEEIKNIFENNILAIYKNKDGIYLYSNTVTEKKDDNKVVDLYKERLNYKNGERIVIDLKISRRIDEINTLEHFKLKMERRFKNIYGKKRQ